MRSFFIALLIVSSFSALAEMKPQGKDYSIDGTIAITAAAQNERLITSSKAKYSLIGPKYWQCLGTINNPTVVNNFNKLTIDVALKLREQILGLDFTYRDKLTSTMLNDTAMRLISFEFRKYFEFESIYEMSNTFCALSADDCRLWNIAESTICKSLDKLNSP